MKQLLIAVVFVVCAVFYFSKAGITCEGEQGAKLAGSFQLWGCRY